METVHSDVLDYSRAGTLSARARVSRQWFTSETSSFSSTVSRHEVQVQHVYNCTLILFLAISRSRSDVSLYIDFQSVPNDVIKQLRQVPHDQIRVTLYVLLDYMDNTIEPIWAPPFLANRTRAAN